MLTKHFYPFRGRCRSHRRARRFRVLHMDVQEAEKKADEVIIRECDLVAAECSGARIAGGGRLGRVGGAPVRACARERRQRERGR